MNFFRTLIAALVAVHAVAAAQEPAKAPLKLVVPFAAGGLADVLARAVGERMRSRFPEGVIVDNRPGAGGNIGADAVFRSPPDGRTLLVSSPGPIAINHGLYPKLPYDPTQWVAVGLLAAVPNALIVRTNLPVDSAPAFVAYVTAHPAKVTYATQGNGTTSHLTAKLFESVVGTEMVHVPYKGDSQALADLSGNQVDVFFGSVGAALTMHKAGRVRILAVADSARSSALPDVPTFAEVGLPTMRSVTWYGVVAPPGTPPATVTTLNAAVVEALDHPEVKKLFADLGLRSMAGRADQAARFLRDETDRWQKIIRDAKVTLE